MQATDEIDGLQADTKNDGSQMELSVALMWYFATGEVWVIPS